MIARVILNRLPSLGPDADPFDFYDAWRELYWDEDCFPLGITCETDLIIERYGEVDTHPDPDLVLVMEDVR